MIEPLVDDSGLFSNTSRPLKGQFAGVIVVNSRDQSVEIQPTFRGLTAVSAHEPGSESIALSTPISPDGIRLYRYQLTK